MDTETDRRKSGVYRHRSFRPVGESVSIGDAIRQAVESLGLTQKFKEQRALSLWPKVAGEQIAAVTQAQTIRHGELYVSVANDTWRHALLFKRDDLRKRLNDAVGNETVRIIRFTK